MVIGVILGMTNMAWGGRFRLVPHSSNSQDSSSFSSLTRFVKAFFLGCTIRPHARWTTSVEKLLVSVPDNQVLLRIMLELEDRSSFPNAG